MQKWLIGAGTITDGQAGDFDGNQKLNGIDLIFMQRKLLETIRKSRKRVPLNLILQAFCGAIGFQAAFSATVTGLSVWNNTHMLNRSTMHGFSLMHLSMNDQCTAQIFIEQ